MVLDFITHTDIRPLRFQFWLRSVVTLLTGDRNLSPEAHAAVLWFSLPVTGLSATLGVFVGLVAVLAVLGYCFGYLRFNRNAGTVCVCVFLQ